MALSKNVYCGSVKSVMGGGRGRHDPVLPRCKRGERGFFVITLGWRVFVLVSKLSVP